MSFTVAKLSYGGKPEAVEVAETLDHAIHRAAKRSATLNLVLAVLDPTGETRALAYAGKARWAIECTACGNYGRHCMLCLGAGKVQDESWRGAI